MATTQLPIDGVFDTETGKLVGFDAGSGEVAAHVEAPVGAVSSAGFDAQGRLLGADGINQQSGKIVKFGSADSTLHIQNSKTTPTVAGEAPGIKVGICAGTENGWLQNPAAGDFVAIYPYVSSSLVRDRIWAINPIIDIPSGSPATAWCYEGNVNVGTSNTPDPRNENHAIGADMVSGGTFAPSAAYATFSSSIANRWKHGIWIDNVGGQAGSTVLRTNSNVSVDYGIDLSTASINYQGLRIGATPAAQVAAVGVRQMANGQVGIFLQRNTDSSPTGYLLQAVNAANNSVLAGIAADGSLYTSVGITAVGSANISAGGLVQGQFFMATAGAGTVGAGRISYGATVATSSTSGAASALPATPAGYIVINVAGTPGKIPYYNN